MMPPDAQRPATRDEILARLAQSRAQIRRLLDPQCEPSGAAGSTAGGAAGEFPRSRTMRMLMSVRGLGAVAAVLGGLLIARPTLAWRLVKLLPTGAIARTLIVRAIAGLKEKRPQEPL